MISCVQYEMLVIRVLCIFDCLCKPYALTYVTIISHNLQNCKTHILQGTQRVWMSSHMLYGRNHCNVKQLLPVENFGQLTLLHLPNKNYRRIGKQGRLGGKPLRRKGWKLAKFELFGNKTEVFQRASTELLKSLELHIAMKRQFPHLQTSNVGKGGAYAGILMVDTDVNSSGVKEKMEAYRSYVERGGFMIDSDMDIDVDAWQTTRSSS